MAFSRLLSLFIFTFVPFLSLHAQVSGTVNDDSVQVLIVKVRGITCSSDLKRISENISQLSGVAGCKVLKQGPKSTFEVRFNPVKTTETAVVAAIQSTPDCENPDKRPYQVVK